MSQLVDPVYSTVTHAQAEHGDGVSVGVGVIVGIGVGVGVGVIVGIGVGVIVGVGVGVISGIQSLFELQKPPKLISKPHEFRSLNG